MRHVAPALLVAVALLSATAGLSRWSANAEPTVAVLQANLDGEQASVPSSTAFGTAEVTLDTKSNVLAWNLSWARFSSDVIAIHFHGPARPGEDATVQVELDVISGLLTPSAGETTVSDAQKAEILSELWYINIHTDDFGGGEIRGQVVRAEASPTPEPTATPPRLLLGDVNCSGAIDSIDATLVLQLDAGLTPSLPCEDSADVNADQEVNSLDALNILFLVAGFIDSLPARSLAHVSVRTRHLLESTPAQREEVLVRPGEPGRVWLLHETVRARTPAHHSYRYRACVDVRNGVWWRFSSRFGQYRRRGEH